jgi:uncharacterized protein YdcH (DUF465 family)
MQVENHPSFTNEFPELKDKIHQFKIGNAHFAKLFDEYHHKDREILRIEEGVENAGDFDLEDLKKQRLHLKDQLYKMLTAG